MKRRVALLRTAADIAYANGEDEVGEACMRVADHFADVSKKVEEFDPPLDAGIEKQVQVLRAAGIETFESCQGGLGHSYAEPTVRFHGDESSALRAVAALWDQGIQVFSLRKTWPIQKRELTGPYWEVTF